MFISYFGMSATAACWEGAWSSEMSSAYCSYMNMDELVHDLRGNNKQDGAMQNMKAW